MTESTDTARYILESLAQLGTTQFVLSPGSRNAPFAYAVGQIKAEDPSLIEMYARIDERDSAFTALGLSRVTLSPAGVISTSGTAIANFYPAILEAYHSGIPLLVITADRPGSMRGSGSNQTTDQRDIYGSHVRAAFDIAPQLPGKKISSMLQDAYQTATSAPRGPVQINVQFDVPLTPQASKTTSPST